MSTRAKVRLAGLTLALAGIAVLVPGSPLYLPGMLDFRGRHGGEPTRHWIDELSHADAARRREALSALGSIGADASEAVTSIAAILRDDPSGDLRSQAALALAKMAPASRTAAPALAQALRDKEPHVRMNAAIALHRLRTDARPAVAALAKAIADEDNHTNLSTFQFTIQEIAALALGRASAGSGDAVADLEALLQRAETAELKVAAAHALGEVGSAAQSAAPALRKLLADSNQAVREAAQASLRAIGGDQIDLAHTPVTLGEFELPESERAYLWNIEHHGNVLVKHGFSRFAAALRNADAAALAVLLADKFAGAELRDPLRIVAKTGRLDVERLQAGGPAETPLDRDTFIDRLLTFRRVFAGAAPQVKFSLMNLGPTTRHQDNGAWSGSALVRMFGEQAPGAPAEVALTIRYEVPRPTEEVLAAPGWLRSCAVTNVVTGKATMPLFAETASQRGLDVGRLHDNWSAAKFYPTTGGVYVCDFDRDGILDMLITDVNGLALYRGKPGGNFENVTTHYGLPLGPVGDTPAAWADLDGDGWEDLIAGGRVYRNDGGKRLVDVSDRCRLQLPHDGGNIIIADYDRDEKLDLYVTRTAPPGGRSWLDEFSSDAKGNYLFRNKGAWQFENVTRAAGAGGGKRSTFSAAWLDADNDGWPDLHVINEFGDGVLLINQRDGKFKEQALANRPADYGSMGLAVGDVNNDGNIDIFCNNMFSKAGTRVISNLAADAFPAKVMEKMRRFVAGSQLHLNQGGLRFEQVGAKMQVAGIGWSYGACLADLDNDGWLDIYATAGYISKSRSEPDG